ncbi:hypothetical protein AB4Z21_27085 [Paenibacillus sp. MCAF20]
MNKTIRINEFEIGRDLPAYFIADIASNHDGDLERAKELIWILDSRACSYSEGSANRLHDNSVRL